MRGFRRHVLILFYIIHDKVTLCCGPSVYQRGEHFKSFVFVLRRVFLCFICWLERDSEMKSKNRIDCERRFCITHSADETHLLRHVPPQKMLKL